MVELWLKCFSFLLSGTTSEKEDVTGSIKIPEVAHDTEADEYVVCDPSFGRSIPPHVGYSSFL